VDNAPTDTPGDDIDHPPADGTGMPAQVDEPTGRGRVTGCLLEIVQTVVLTAIIFLIIQNFVAQPFKVQQFSMERTFEQGDYVLVDRLTPLFAPYERGQVVVFHPPKGVPQDDPFIKRVIGVGGDTVEVRSDGRVYVNGTALSEPYLYKDADGVAQPTEPASDEPVLVPQGMLFVMGDHREESEDSRVFGTIPVSSVIGRAMFRYWPLASFSIIATPTYAGVPAP
jgi:signal peptidase I